jgi:type II secretory pathway component GspD/PulD (secretin)
MKVVIVKRPDGYLFKTVNKESTLTETVIFIKATIINSGSGASKYDREINDKFSSSKREF